MKVLIATRETQGKRRNDFCHAEPPEFVQLGFECDGEKVDGSCGCKRSFVGMSTHKATTTAQVVERVMDEAQFMDIYFESQKRAGWIKDDSRPAEFVEGAKELLRLADHFPVGAVIEKRGRTIQTRRG